MLWAYIDLVQSFRQPKRALDWVAYLVSAIVGGLMIGGLGIGGAVWLMKLSGTVVFAKLIGGFAGFTAGWVILLLLNVQLFRLTDWVYESLGSRD
jgi:formate/nitrite transporter FocA (FNT family)